MLINFTLENILSFKDAQNISMEASASKKDNFLTENVININTKKVLKSALIYGANASGKTNLLSALGIFKSIVRPNNDLENILSEEITPFLLNKENVTLPSDFEVEFFDTDNNIQYRYGISIFKDAIEEEWLFFKDYQSEKIPRETMLFHREKQKIAYNKTSFKEASLFVSKNNSIEKTPKHKPLVTNLVTFDGYHSKNVLNFFDKLQILSGLEDNKLQGYTFNLLQKDEEFKKFALNILRDFQIQNIIVSEIKPQEIRKFNEKISKKDEKLKELLDSLHNIVSSQNLRTINVIKKLSNSEDTINFPLELESSGTKKVIHFLGPLYDTFKNGNILIIDEFDSKFHTLLTKKIFNIFHENCGNSQLIANVQDTCLMDTSIFRRDQIWFVDKSNIEQSSSIYSLVEYKNSIKKSYSNDYLIGTFDAIPLFSSLAEVNNLMKEGKYGKY